MTRLHMTASATLVRNAESWIWVSESSTCEPASITSILPPVRTMTGIGEPPECSSQNPKRNVWSCKWPGVIFWSTVLYVIVISLQPCLNVIEQFCGDFFQPMLELGAIELLVSLTFSGKIPLRLNAVWALMVKLFKSSLTKQLKLIDYWFMFVYIIEDQWWVKMCERCNFTIPQTIFNDFYWVLNVYQFSITW